MASSADELEKPARKRQRAWVERREARSAELPAGPSSQEELFAWPADLARSLCHAGRADDEEIRVRLVTWLRSGVMMYTDYSGIDCPRAGMEYSIKGIESELGMTFDKPPLMVKRTCDHGPTQTAFLAEVSRAVDNSMTCHFCDLSDRLPPIVKQYIDASMPPAESNKDEKSHAYASIKHWLHEHRGIAFPPGATSQCVVHGRQCPVRPQGPPSSQGVNGANDSADPSVDNALAPLRINVAGVTCVGWSNSGKQERYAHSSEVAHHIWATERRVFMEEKVEDLTFIECVPKYPAMQKLGEALGTAGTVMSIVDGPELHGWPHRRRRRMSVILNNATVCWVGPSDYKSDFASRFHRSTVLTGDKLMVATPEERNAEYAHLAKQQKHNLLADDVPGIDSESLLALVLPPGSIARMKAWQEYRDQNELLREKPLCCDLEHWPHTKGSTAGPDWPVQLTHGMPVAIGVDGDARSWKIATSMEHLAAMGWPLYEHVCTRFGVSPLLEIFKNMSRRKLKLVSGNSMHLVVQSAWMLYIISHTARIPDSKPGRFISIGSCDAFEHVGIAEGSNNDDAVEEEPVGAAASIVSSAQPLEGSDIIASEQCRTRAS